jgi:hypothetical protein
MMRALDPAPLARLWNSVREISPDAIARDSERVFTILICGQPGAGKRTLRASLAGALPLDYVLPYVRVVDGLPSDTFVASLCIWVVDASAPPDMTEWRDALVLAARVPAMLYVLNKADKARDLGAARRAAEYTLGGGANGRLVSLSADDAKTVAHSLAPALLDAVPDLRLAVARRLPLFRDAAARRAIAEASRVNAELALMSSLPASIPLVNVAVAGADTIVLTKNQAMLLLKLAALHGRTIASPVRLIVEIAPVVGASFLWRTIARAVVGLLPGYVSAVPKAVVAFVGTYVVGTAANYYYRLGVKPSGQVIESYAREAGELARQWVAQAAPKLLQAPARATSLITRRVSRSREDQKLIEMPFPHSDGRTPDEDGGC